MRLTLRLIDAGFVSVYLPEIVTKEFLTKRIQTAKDKIQKSNSELIPLERTLKNGSRLKLTLDKTISDLKTSLDICEEEISQNFYNWINENSITILPIKHDHFKSAFDDYFSGKGVYKKIKSREDIPDSLISFCIEEFAKSNDRVYVAVKDQRFKSHLDKIENITTIESLENFLELRENVDSIKYLNSISENSQEIRKVIGKEQFRAYLQSYLRSPESNSSYIYLEAEEIDDKSLIPIDYFGLRAEITKPDSIGSLSIKSIDIISARSFSLKVSFDALAVISYCTDYQSYMEIEEDLGQEVNFESMNGDGICDLSQEWVVNFSGVVTIETNELMTSDEFSAHIHYLSQQQNPISITLETLNAELKRLAII
ncbi:MAG: PIN domain-containing protein [Marinobacter nauticus]